MSMSITIVFAVHCVLAPGRVNGDRHCVFRSTKSGRDRWACQDSRLPRTGVRSSRPPSGCSARAASTRSGHGADEGSRLHSGRLLQPLQVERRTGRRGDGKGDAGPCGFSECRQPRRAGGVVSVGRASRQRRGRMPAVRFRGRCAAPDRRGAGVRAASPRTSIGWNGWWPRKARRRRRRAAMRSRSSARWSARSCCRARSPAPIRRWLTRSRRRAGDAHRRARRSGRAGVAAPKRHAASARAAWACAVIFQRLAALFDRPCGIPQRLGTARRIPGGKRVRHASNGSASGWRGSSLSEYAIPSISQRGRVATAVAEHFGLPVMDQFVRESRLPAARCDHHAEIPERQRRALAEAERIGARPRRAEHDARRRLECTDGRRARA